MVSPPPVSKPPMRLGPTLSHPPGLTEHQRLSCAKCRAEFIILQMVKINDKQLCIWCAGHPGNMPTRAFTMNSRPTVSKRRVVYKDR